MFYPQLASFRRCIALALHQLAKYSVSNQYLFFLRIAFANSDSHAQPFFGEYFGGNRELNVTAALIRRSWA